jgi:hypothetical protein
MSERVFLLGHSGQQDPVSLDLSGPVISWPEVLGWS